MTKQEYINFVSDLIIKARNIHTSIESGRIPHASRKTVGLIQKMSLLLNHISNLECDGIVEEPEEIGEHPTVPTEELLADSGELQADNND